MFRSKASVSLQAVMRKLLAMRRTYLYATPPVGLFRMETSEWDSSHQQTAWLLLVIVLI
jgi:hypothetical protein